MRVLPYFQNSQINRTVPIKQRKIESPQTVQIDTATPASAKVPVTAVTDKFIPSSPVTGVVHSIKSFSVSAEKYPGIVKSGDYSFYKLDGVLENGTQTPRGDKLDIKG